MKKRTRWELMIAGLAAALIAAYVVTCHGRSDGAHGDANPQLSSARARAPAVQRVDAEIASAQGPQVGPLQIAGSVRTATAPLAGARIHARLGEDYSTVLSELDGTFKMWLSRGGLTVFAVDGLEVISGSPVVVDANQRDIALIVSGEAHLAGRVLLDGRPIAGAKVTMDQQFSVYSGPGGAYSVGSVAPGPHVLQAESMEHGAKNTPLHFTLGAGDTRGVDIELDRRASIAGSLFDEDDEPIEGLSVRWVCDRCPDEGHALTQHDGSYLVDYLTGRGEYEPIVRDREGFTYPPADGSFPRIRLDHSSTRVEGVRLAVRRALSSIVGRVIDPDGAAAPNTTVVAILPDPRRHPVPLMSVITDDRGVFRLERLPHQPYTIGAGKNGMLGTLHEVTPGPTEVVVKLPRLGTLHGRLEGFEVGPVSVSVLVGGTTDLHTKAHEGSNEFQIADVPEGEWWIAASNGADVGLQRARMPAHGSGEIVVVRAGRGRVQGVIEGDASAPWMSCRWAANLEDAGVSWFGTFAPGRDREFDIVVAEGVPLILECHTAKLRGTTSIAALPPRGRLQTSIKLEPERGSTN